MDINKIKLDNKFKLVEASAGTGKSFTLAHIVLRNVLEKKVKPDEILLLSFTKNTCSELRDKILSRFHNLKLYLQSHNESKIDNTLKDWYLNFKDKDKSKEKIISEIDNFINQFYKLKVTTFHAFCNNIIKDLQTLAYPITKLKHLEGNPRVGNVDAVKKSYEKFGQRKPIVANEDGEVISGNHQLAAARELGWDKIAVVFTKDDELTAKAFALADNRTADLGTYDNDLLADMLASVSSDLEMLEATSFTEDDLIDLLEKEVVENEVPEPPKNPKTKLGDVYLLGNHKLYCGDTLDLYKEIFGYEMIWLDPPYGLGGYGGRSGKFDGIIGDDLKDDEIVKFYSFAEANTIYAWCNWNTYHYVLEALGMPRSLIVWAKTHFGMGKGYRRQHEFVAFYGNLDSTSESDLWSEKKDSANTYKHPTQKPIALSERALKNSTKVNDVVFDPFAGSGSMLLACEQLKRKWIGIELDPGYCDVIIERWETMTGNKAQKVKL